MRDRIRPPRDLEPILDELKEEGIFQTKQKGMMFAAALGYAIEPDPKKHRAPDKWGEGIRLEYFRNPDDDGFIGALAVAAENDLGVLARERDEQMVNLFERCACTGLRELKRRMEVARSDYLEVIMDVLDELGGEGDEDNSTERKVKRLQGLV